MADYPDPDEEYELMYADELEMMRETEETEETSNIKKKPFQAKRSLDFSSPGPKKPAENVQENINTETTQNDHISLTPSLQPVDDILTPVNSSNKRTVDDLFGDINDIDFNEVCLPSKRQKTEEEIDTELIEKILEGRKLKQILLEPSRGTQVTKSNYDAKDNLSLDIPRWSFLPLTNWDGERVYVKLETEDNWAHSLDVVPEMPSLHSTYASVWAEARKILEKKQEEQARIESQLTQPLPDMESENYGTKLWVDKYRPDSYVDLLSDEPVNRAVLHWLHLWDKVVFKKEVKVKEPQERNSFSKRTGQFQLTNRWKGKMEAVPELDEDGRPHHKVALLCGPPGVGKTTLAHLLARLAGYRPVELNASDERSVEAFRSALQSATLMRSVIDKEKRPNCLILDEIDGAPLPTVELLVKWCTASTSESNKKKAKSHPLRRPVIAICNDLYATALRPLRAIAQIIHVGGITTRRLTARLAWVAQCEGLTVSPHVLAGLAQRAKGDVRAAIQVLSFIKAKAKQQLSMEDVMNANIGERDCNKSLLQALHAIFNRTDDADPARHCLAVISAHGEYDRIMDGIFENYLDSHVDARLITANTTLSWLRTYDVANSWIQRNQNYSLYGMLPLCAAGCRRIATRVPAKIKYPTQGQEMYRKKVELESIIYSVSRGVSPAVSVNRRALLLDVLSLLPYLLAPELRNPNVQLCSENERKSVRTAAAAMCDYGLLYVQQKTLEGLYAFVLEPDIYRVAFFGTEERVKPSPAVRQAIAREQQMENIRRTEAMAGRIITRTQQDAAETAKRTDMKNVQTSRLPNHLQRLKPKEVEKSAPQGAARPNFYNRRKVHKDFFGRIVPMMESSQRTDGARDVVSSSSIFYQYREGFNNAVRRSVRVRDLM